MLGAGVVAAVTGRVGPLESWLSYESAPTRLAWSPAGDRIAFEKRTGAIEILSLGRVSFGTEVVHADHGATTELDDWSPDGRALVFVRGFQVFILDVETGEARYLAAGAHVVWSQDGLEIAIASGRKIYGIHPDGTGFRTIANVDSEISSLAWSPDSTRLAFVGKVIGLVARSGGRPPTRCRPSRRLRGAHGIFYNLTRVAPVQTAVWRFDSRTNRCSRVTAHRTQTCCAARR
jgi:dipeptidyl aminopeptidase/acylaminoacyl peptidase